MATIIPIMNPNREFAVWLDSQRYTGPNGTGKYVPNVDDLVISYVTGLNRVTSVDYTTGLSTITPTDFIDLDNGDGVDTDSLLLSRGPGTVAESFRMYLDTSVTPHRLAVDTRVRVPGSSIAYMKVFLGTNIEDDGIVISRMYDNTGEFISENIPMERIEVNNASIKRPLVGYCSRDLPSGELVTAVYYTADDVAVEISRFLINNTTWIRSVNSSAKYIKSIRLESPFLSDSDDRILEVPINIPTNAIDLIGVVEYSDGDIVKLPVDGTKFDLYGFRSLISTVLGEQQPMSLVYYLGENEVAEDVGGGVVPTKMVSYLAETIAAENAYTVKLFTYPVWIDAINGYRLKHYLYNLERNVVFDVSSYIEVSTNSPAFDPVLYGVAQKITFALDLSKVDVRFKAYRHLQTTTVTLFRHGTESATKWTVNYDNTKPSFGDNINADVMFVNSNLWTMNLNNGFGSMEEWLRETYLKVLPLYDNTSEAAPVTPNMFRIKTGSYQMEFGTDMWNQDITINTSLKAGDLATLEFIKRDSTGDLELAIVGMPIRLV